MYLSRKDEPWEDGVNGIVPEDREILRFGDAHFSSWFDNDDPLDAFDDDDDGKHGELLCVVRGGGEEESDNHLGKIAMMMMIMIKNIYTICLYDKDND